VNMSDVLRRTEERPAQSGLDECASRREAGSSLPDRNSRKAVMRRAVAGTAAFGFGALTLSRVFGPADAAASKRNDTQILNFLLLLEQLQHDFYAEAAGAAALGARMRHFASVASEQDRAHAKLLRSLLGDRANTQARFRFGDTTASEANFAPVALKLKEAVVASYIGEGPNLATARVTEVATIVSVDARHAAWIRAIVGELPAPRASDRSTTAEDVMRLIRRWGFVEGT
jgi:hypothetical protein